MSHTKGPWTFDDPGESTVGLGEGIMILANNAPDRERLVAECLSPSRNLADARLIAAAPELLAVVTDVVRARDAADEAGDHYAELPTHVTDEARKALAAARGES